MKRLFALLMLAALVIGCLAGCAGDTPATNGNDQPRQTHPTVLPNNGQHTPTQLLGNVSVTMELEGYPECYGGCYIDEATQVVVILVTDQDRTHAMLDSVLSLWEEDDYRFQETNLPYSALAAVQQQLEAARETLNQQSIEITKITIDAQNGKVIAGVTGLDSAKEQAVRAAVDSPLLQLQNS